MALMRVKALGFDIPNLTSNPFSAIPLEGNKSELYVGRLDIRKRLAQHIRFKSARRILMVGEVGSGRTSLLRCAALKAPVSVHIDHISESNPRDSLLQRMYSELVDYNFPSNSVELVKKMVDYSYTFNESLPLIVIDTPNVEDSVLFHALRNLLPSLERLQAVIVVVVESKQRMSIQENLLNSFDNIETLAPLSVDEVQALVEKRVSSASRQDFKLAFEHAKSIHNRTGGLPLEVVKLMRDAIDDSLLGGLGDVEQIESRRPHHEMTDEANNIDLIPEDKPSTIHESDIIDASLPWDKRDAKLDDRVIMPEDNLFDFDLDLEELSESQEMDGTADEFEYSANPSNEEIIIADSKPKPSIDAGAFGGLLGRTRDYDAMEKSEPDEMINQLNNHGTELWVSKDMVELQDKVDFDEQNSAELIHDEIGVYESQENSLDNIEIPIEPIEITENQQYDNFEAVNILASLLTQIMHTPSSNPTTGDNKLLQSLIRFNQGKYSEKVDYPLNPTVLSTLNSSESYVVSIAKVRLYSPSDKAILSHLGIKRPRLSQISNKLLRSGILCARMKGRSRYYELTQTAKAQLIAWGIMEVDE